MSKIVFNKIFFSLSILFMFSGCNSTDLENEFLEQMMYSFTYEGKTYIIVKEANSWQDAVTYAVASGGYLAEINSEQEQTAIFSELVMNANITFDETNNQFGFAAVWLGGNDLETEGVWVWNGNHDKTTVQFWNGGVDGNTVNGQYNNWGIEPDNKGDQDVLSLGLKASPINAAGKWTDLDGAANHLFFLIEYD